MESSQGDVYDPSISGTSGDEGPSLFQQYYPMTLQGGGELRLPFRTLDGQPDMAIALLMTSQCSFGVIHELADRLAKEAKSLRADAVAGISSLGWILAPRVAESLGLENWVPLTTTKKYWQDRSLAAPASSITSGGGKDLYLDQYIQDRVRGKTIVVIDDGTNTGGSAAAAIEVLRKGGAEDVHLLLVFTEGHDWEERFKSIGFEWQTHLHCLGHLPIFKRAELKGTLYWEPIAGTE